MESFKQMYGKMAACNDHSSQLSPQEKHLNKNELLVMSHDWTHSEKPPQNLTDG